MAESIRHRHKGFNLLEVVIASFLFSVVAVAFLGVWGMQVRAMEKSRHNLVATMLAEEIIEEIMSAGYELTPLTEGEPKLGFVDMEMEHRGANGEWATITSRYESEVTVTEIGTGDDRLKQVTVKVTWDDSSHVGEIVLETYLAGAF